MHFEGSIEVAAPRRDVWQFLTDPETVATCVPGLKSFEVRERNQRYRLVVSTKLGAIRPIFDLEVTYTANDPPRLARLRIRGTGPSTHIGASSFMQLNSTGDGITELIWSFNLAASGLVASVGERLLGDVFARLSQEFLERVKSRLESIASQSLAPQQSQASPRN